MTEDGEQQFVAVYDRYFRAVLRYALARVSPEQAKDVAAETFLIAWRRRGELPAEPAAWLFGVARRVIAGHLTSQGVPGSAADQTETSTFQWLPVDPATLALLQPPAIAAGYTRVNPSGQ